MLGGGGAGVLLDNFSISPQTFSKMWPQPFHVCVFETFSRVRIYFHSSAKNKYFFKRHVICSQLPTPWILTTHPLPQTFLSEILQISQTFSEAFRSSLTQPKNKSFNSPDHFFLFQLEAAGTDSSSDTQGMQARCTLIFSLSLSTHTHTHTHTHTCARVDARSRMKTSLNKQQQRLLKSHELSFGFNLRGKTLNGFSART